jgi:hypothetical protein
MDEQALQQLADALYRAGYSDKQNGRDYDPRNTEQWQAVVDALQPVRPAEPCRPDIIERLTYHALERDDLTLDECWDVLASGWAKVHGRSERQMVMQIMALLASQPTAPASKSATNMGAHALANELAQAVSADEADPDGHDMSAGLFGPSVSKWLRKVAGEYLSKLAAPVASTDFAGVLAWIGDKQCKVLITQSEIAHEREPGFELSRAASQCCAKLTGAAPVAPVTHQGYSWQTCTRLELPEGYAVDGDAMMQRTLRFIKHPSMVVRSAVLEYPEPPVAPAALVAPVAMVLHCPKCGTQHIDAPEAPDLHPSSTGEDDHEPWANPPHRSHLCHACGTIWRPADVATTGVAGISTKGKADTWAGGPAAPAATTTDKTPAGMLSTFCPFCENGFAFGMPTHVAAVPNPITEAMHVAAVKVLLRASGLDGLPQRMLDAMLQASPTPPVQPELTAAARDVLAERERQISTKGWTPEHDDVHDTGELARAAACYADPRIAFFTVGGYFVWPWDSTWWKPSDRRRNLIKAGALILAEVERFDRAAQAEGGR